MDSNPSKKKQLYYTNCIRSFNNAAIINDYGMDKEQARAIFKSSLKLEYDGPRMSLFQFMTDLRKLKVIQKPKNFNRITFEKNVFNAIIKDAAYVISTPMSKKIVNQSYAFKERPTLNSTQKNGTAGRTNKTVPTKSVDLVIEVNPGQGEWKEHINCFGLSNIKVKAQNCSSDAIEVINIKSHHSSEYINVPPFSNTIKLLPGETYILNISVQIPENGAFDCPLLFKYIKNGITCGVMKQLYLEYYPEEFNELLPTLVYKRSKPVIVETDFVIISGELPKAAANFKSEVRLNSYSLSKDFIHVINTGLKLEDVNSNCHELCRSILETLNVPDPLHPLTTTNYCKLLDLLLKIEEHQMQIDIRSYDMVDAKLDRAGRLFVLEVLGLSEHRPSLIVGDYVDVTDMESKTKYRGYVHEKMLDKVHIAMHRSFSENAYVKNKSFHVSFGYNRTTLKLEHRAIEYLKNSKAEKYFFPTSTIGNKYNNLSLKWINPNCTLNAEQKTAVMHILNNTSYPAPYLIFGPPGTGKTMTVVEAIQQVYKIQPEKKILVCTPSNNAANVINLRLLNIPVRDLLRYISYSFPYPEINTEIIKYCNYESNTFYHPVIDDVLKKRIVITTLTNAGRLLSLGVPPGHFDYIFMDESGHATETETLIPLAGIFCNPKIIGQLTGQIVMVGDPMQLGPIIHSSVAGKYGFGTSMLERLMTTIELYKKNDNVYDSNVLTKLLENYRSHSEILKIPNDKFYDGELVPKAGPLSNLAIGEDILINKNYPMIFHCAVGQDMREESSPSFFNIVECSEVMYYLNRLIGSRMKGMTVEPKHIGVITPYRKQVKKLKQLCKKRQYEDLAIGSIEQFQGQERLIIIISTVRSNVENMQHDKKFHLGFLKNPKRFNVAITRAKALVIVIGNPHILQYDEYWRAYIEACVKNNSVVGQRFTLKSPEELLRDESYQLISSMNSLQINDDKVFKRGDI